MRRFDAITLSMGDITCAQADAIVNAAAPAMLGGGGVDGAIHRAAGPELVAACRQVPAIDGVRCPPGEARITPGFKLPARFVIHTVGPVYQGAETSGPVLTRAYRACLNMARTHGLKRLVFPAISCGVYGYPHGDAADIALTTCRDHGHDLDEIHFVLFSAAMYNVWVEHAEHHLSGPSSAP
jgi:O-acetyl-ADP-ribose deacetylase (regulator of RNase III)